ncbi:DUF3422 family protein [Roseateles puraquae]|uniref:Egg lysin n=1 Tax=Roseateles puraquae TaxID=431059 RepID=A0A254N3T3_9BURK|nr:DUF3422 domain-containing protein [Roseateles puraquae]MDG0854355.1 DUF3422 family protein [Roseateles puraquae]OWR00760.1 hypothetical protein CDO81_23775 [Roseateles puraquae]
MNLQPSMQTLALPRELPQRQRLADELHARPFETLASPGRVLSIATLRTGAAQDAQWLAHLTELEPSLAASGATHLRLQWRGLRIKWERHTEFFSLSLFCEGGEGGAFDTAWLDVLPDGWLERLPGEMVSATLVALVPCAGEPPHVREVAPLFGSEPVVGNRIADGAATVVTDLRAVDGVTRFLVFDHALNRRRAGRTAQRLVEIDTYRMMALLSLPLAARRMGELGAEEAQLASLMERFRGAADGDEALLGELVSLAARVEHALADHGARFSATRAYGGIVDRRMAELREAVVPGLQPLSEFLDRRFRPAVESCAATAARQAELSKRIARAAQLLQTRSEVERERQNQSLLASLDRRQGMQLRLQEMVEGLSVIAMSYYGVGLAAYALKPLAKAVGANEAWVIGALVPVVGLAVMWNLRRLRRHLAQAH